MPNNYVFYNTGKAHFQIIVGDGETVQLLAKADLASDWSPVAEDFTASTWIYTEDLPLTEMKFVVPAGSQVVRVSAVR